MKENGRIKKSTVNYKDVAKIKTKVMFCQKCQQKKEVSGSNNMCDCGEKLLDSTLPNLRRLN